MTTTEKKTPSDLLVDARKANEAAFKEFSAAFDARKETLTKWKSGHTTDEALADAKTRETTALAKYDAAGDSLIEAQRRARANRKSMSL